MDIDWNDLRLFLAVARLGGLSAARARTGVSQATLGRRVTALERAIGAALFVRRQQGYSLTPAGAALLAHAEAMEQASHSIARWREGREQRRIVRLSAGGWTSDFLARHIHRLWMPADPLEIEMVTANERIDIGRRAADIGIRNARPSEAWLAGRLIGKVAFALYARAGWRGTPDDAGFVGVAAGAAAIPSARWLDAEHGARIVMRGNDGHAVRELVAQGIGLGVFPCFVGDRDDRLVRVGAPIAALGSEQWLVMHHEERHDRAVHLVANRIARLMRESRDLFAGRADQPGRTASA